MSDLFEARMTLGRMRNAAMGFMENLSVEQRARATFPFDAEGERRDWDFVPKQGRNGLPLKDMDYRQQQLAHFLITAGLSVPGYAKVVTIMGFESVLRELQKDRMGLSAADFRSPGLYFVSIFGRPNNDETWGWRVVGHHVSLNYTVVEGKYLAPTPCLLGAEPAEYGVFHPLKEDETLGFELLFALSDAQRQRAVIHDVAPPNFVTRVVPRIGQEELPEVYELGFDNYRISEHDRDVLKYVRNAPKGLPAAAMDDAQRAKLTAIIQCFVGRMPDEVAAKHLEKVQQAGLDNFAFAWAGGQEPGTPHYFRIQGPAFLIELENAQSGGNHVHAVWRDPDNDFGHDLLLQHYQVDHHAGELPVRFGRVTSSMPA
jgi:hypothetical protein